jgi:hypothetical protein
MGARLRALIASPRGTSLLIGVLVVLGVVGYVFVLAQPHRPAIIRPPHHEGPVNPPAEMGLSGENGTLLTPAQAETIVRTWWRVAETALAQNDAAVTDLVETGPAAEYNDAVTADNLVRGGNLRTARPLQALEVRVPALRQYPGYFFAEVLTSTYATATADNAHRAPYQEYVVFVRPSADATWKVALNTGGNAGAWPPFPPTYDQGTEYNALPSGQFVVDPAAVPATVASYRTDYVRNAGRPRLTGLFFEKGYWADTALRQLVDGVRVASQKSWVEHWTFSADSARDGFYQFATGDGDNLVCFVNRYRRSVAGLGVKVQQDADRDNWGSWLKPGNYAEVDVSGLQQSCVLDPKQGTTRLQLYGGNGGIVGVTGVN